MQTIITASGTSLHLTFTLKERIKHNSNVRSDWNTNSGRDGINPGQTPFSHPSEHLLEQFESFCLVLLFSCSAVFSFFFPLLRHMFHWVDVALMCVRVTDVPSVYTSAGP